ncbi:MAG: hypothetical protein H8E57_04790 [Candidatus Cloacimonetes bacterium]|nr:hypothetical protein [Candidatus Cloacimonadota bacterium]
MPGFNEKKKKLTSYDCKKEYYDSLLSGQEKQEKQQENPDRVFRLEKIKQLRGKDKLLIDTLIDNNYSIKKTAEKLGENINTIKSARYRIVSRINADLKKKNGLRITKKLLNSHQRKNLDNFIHKFLSCLKNNNLEKMRIYFGKRIPASRFAHIQVIKIIEHGPIKILGNKINYSVHYIDHNGRKNFFYFTFRFNKNNSPRIIKSPWLPRKIFTIKNEDMPSYFMDKLNSALNGYTKISDDEVEQILSCVKKTVYHNY